MVKVIRDTISGKEVRSLPRSLWRTEQIRALEQRWAEVAHVPLLVKDPGQQQPATVTAPRSTGQIAQTVLNAVGATASPDLALSPDLSTDLDHGPVFTTIATTGKLGFTPALTGGGSFEIAALAAHLQTGIDEMRAAGINTCNGGRTRVLNLLEDPATRWWSDWTGGLRGFEGTTASLAAVIGTDTGQRVTGTRERRTGQDSRLSRAS